MDSWSAQYFGELRHLLTRPPHAMTWQRVCALVELAPDEVAEQWVAYVLDHLRDVPEALRVVHHRSRWYDDLFLASASPRPIHRLIARMELAAAHRTLDEQATRMAALPTLDRLRSLYTRSAHHGGALTTSGWDALCDAPHLRTLREVSVDAKGLRGDALARLAEGVWPELHTLALRTHTLPDEALRALAAPQLRNLRALHLGPTSCSTETIDALGEALALESLQITLRDDARLPRGFGRGLRALALEQHAGEPEVWRAVFDALHGDAAPTLRTLSVQHHTNATGAFTRALVSVDAGVLPALDTMRLGVGGPHPFSTASSLDALRRSPLGARVTTLCLDRLGNADGWAEVFQDHDWSHLETLDLRGPEHLLHIEPDHLDALAGCRSLTGLTTLRLSYALGTDALDALGRLLSCGALPSLQELEISSAPRHHHALTGALVNALARIPHTQPLHTLRLPGAVVRRERAGERRTLHDLVHIPALRSVHTLELNSAQLQLDDLDTISRSPVLHDAVKRWYAW